LLRAPARSNSNGSEVLQETLTASMPGGNIFLLSAVFSKANVSIHEKISPAWFSPGINTGPKRI
jgi:hypothetical protein